MKTVTQVLKDKIKESFHLAELDRSNLREFDRDLYGASGRKIKHCINNICGLKDNLTYLELGVYRGSTLIAANFRNSITTYAVDDYTIDQKEANPYKETGWTNPRQAVVELIDRYKNSEKLQNIINLIDSEASKVNLKSIPRKVDVVHYDLEEHHANLESVLRHYIPIFDKHFILMVSNWNSQGVRTAYSRFAKSPGIDVELLAEKVSFTTGDSLNWYNGFSVSLVTISAAKEEKKEETND
jgi:hypothetical protein